MPARPATSRLTVIAAILLIAILASLGVALVALFKRGDHSQTLLRALTVRVSLSVFFFLLLMLGWYLGYFQPHALGG
jgi:hypothetical protein